MINRKFSRYYQKTRARASGWYDCGSAALVCSEEINITRETNSLGVVLPW
jgi:hypothetical protein